MLGELSCIVVLVSLGLVHSFDPLTMSAIGLVGAGASVFFSPKLYCHFYECCDNNWLMLDTAGIETSLNEELFGQHIASKTVADAVKYHVENKHPTSPLVMFFDGWTGNGKSFTSDIVAKHLFKKGLDSKFIIKKIGTKYYPHSKLEEYKKELKELIESSTKKCDRSLFIFDNAEKFPEGLGDVLKPYIDYHHSIDGIDYRKNIFIFISNTAGGKINEYTLNHFLSGKRREDIARVEISKIISENAFNLPGGLKYSKIISSAFIGHYVPFLPLERKHVKQCAAAELKKRNRQPDDRILEDVASEMIYFPDKEKIFSSAGCKTIAQKVDLFLLFKHA